MRSILRRSLVNMTVSLPVGIDITKDLAILFLLCSMEMICQLLLGLAAFRFFLDFKRSFMIPKQLTLKTKPRYLEFIKIQFHREVTLYKRSWLELENKSSMHIPHSNPKDNLLHWFNFILHRTFCLKIPAVARQGSTADFMIHADMLSPIKSFSQCYPSDAICIHRDIYEKEVHERAVFVDEGKKAFYYKAIFPNWIETHRKPKRWSVCCIFL